MAIPGKKNTLPISKIVDFGVYLDGGDLGEILLPMKWVPENTKPDDMLDVFIYFDSSDRLIATTMNPLAVVGDFAFLKVSAVDKVAAFLDWGLEKDLILPYREQTHTVQKGNYYPVHVFADDRGRIASSMYLEKFTEKDVSELKEGQDVDLFIYAATDLGFKAIVNNRYEGILYANEIFQNLTKGERIKGYIKKVREDSKIDLSLYKTGYENKIDDLSSILYEKLKSEKGFLPVNDYSSPDEIYSLLKMSKKNFKKSVGNLYRSGLIRITEDGIYLS